jgi:hypothetical protein
MLFARLLALHTFKLPGFDGAQQLVVFGRRGVIARANRLDNPVYQDLRGA